ncbi:MAG: MBL fold metallo-hydrolase [Planctomycetota bacterium]|jgi:glyoxylase-like metal-dependent hydrolase (beta-lactamase superfamily II)
MLIKNPPVEIAEGVRMLGTNEYPVFLVTDQDEGAIFEGGVGAAGPVVREQLAALDIGANVVKQIIVTHAHPDHVMAVPAFRQMFPIGVEKAVGFFKKIDGMLTEALVEAGSIRDEHRPEPLKDNQIAVDDILADGDTVTVGRRKFNVLATPGHSDCSLSFYESATRLLIISDATGYYVPDFGYFWPNYFTGYGAYLESIRRLATLDVELLCLSHNAVVKGAEAVKAYFEGATAATEAYHERIVSETAAGKAPDEISRQLGIEVHEKTQLLGVEFFQKNCEQLVKQSLKYSQGD